MNILLVSLHHVEYAVELACGLGERHDVRLVLSRERVLQTIGPGFPGRMGGRISWTLLDKRSFRGLPSWKSIFNIVRMLLFTRYDVVHLQDCGSPFNLLFLFLSVQPVIMTIHDVKLHPGREQSAIGPRRLWGRSKIIKYGCSRVIVHGRKLKEDFLALYDKPASDVFVVPHGCLFSFAGAAGESHPEEEPHTVLLFGRMEPYKGLALLLRAEPLVSRKIGDFKIIVAGAGDDLARYRKELLANRHVELHEGFIPNDDVSSLFRRSAAVVLPYLEASQSGIAAMAFAFGKPVIATDVGSLPEVVLDGKVGKVVPAGDAEKLADAIISLLSNREQRIEMGRAALGMAEGDLGWKRIAGLTEQVYRDALGLRRRA